MKKQRKQYAPEEKVAILRRHLLEKEPVSKFIRTSPRVRSLNFRFADDPLGADGCVLRFAQYSAKMRLISARSSVLARASISKMRAFCGFRLSAGIMPILSYSSRATT